MTQLYPRRLQLAILLSLLQVETHGWIQQQGQLSPFGFSNLPSQSLLRRRHASPTRFSPVQGTVSLWSALAEDNQGMLSNSDDGDDDDDDEDYLQRQNQKQNPSELWLDLRGTAIYPKEALTFLQEFVFDDDDATIDSTNTPLNGTTASTSSSPFGGSPSPPGSALPNSSRRIRDLVDGILVSHEMYQTLSSQQQQRSSIGRILYENGQGDLLEMRQSTDTTNRNSQQQTKVGKIITPNRDGMLNPLAIMDMDPLDGWILIDATADDGAMAFDQDDDNSRTDQVAGFLQFVTATRFMPSSSLKSLGSERGNSHNQNELSINKGGIAMACPTQAYLFFADRSLTQQQLLLQGTMQTESGILLTEEDPDDDNGGQNQLPTALVIPFDLRLWRAACEIHQSKY